MNTILICLSISFSAFNREETLFEKEIQVLIEKMGDDDFEIRDKAYNDLILLIKKDDGYLLFPLLEKAIKNKDPEISYRAGMVLKKYYYILPKNYPYIPWIDMLNDDTPNKKEIVKKYLDMAPNNIEHSSSVAFRYFNYRIATMFYCVDLLKSGMKRSKVQEILNEMAEKEKEWWKNNRGRN